MDGFGNGKIGKQVPVVGASLAPNASSARPPMVVVLEPTFSVEEFESKLREECTGEEVELVVHSLKSRHGVVVEQTGRAVVSPQFVADIPFVVKVLTPEGEFRKTSEPPTLRAPYVSKPKPSLAIGTIFDDLLSSDNETEGEEEGEETTSAAPLTEAEREELARQQRSREKNASKRSKKKQQKSKNKPEGNKGKEVSDEPKGSNWFW